jgi:hypothetical protein
MLVFFLLFVVNLVSWSTPLRGNHSRLHARAQPPLDDSARPHPCQEKKEKKEKKERL